jgi:hypothetical protein
MEYDFFNRKTHESTLSVINLTPYGWLQDRPPAETGFTLQIHENHLIRVMRYLKTRNRKIYGIWQTRLWQAMDLKRDTLVTEPSGITFGFQWVSSS